VQSPCARLVRIMSTTILPRRYTRRPRLTLRSLDRQRACSRRELALCAWFSPLYLPGRGVRYVLTIVNAQNVS